MAKKKPQVLEKKYNLNVAKKQVIDLIKRSSYDFCTDIMNEIKNAANNDCLADVEMFADMIRTSENISEKQIEKVNKAVSISEILTIADDDAPGNALFEQEDIILSTILGFRIRQDWGDCC